MAERSKVEGVEMMNILVTGDRGYIGSTLVPLLLAKGYGVVGLDTHFFRKRLDSSKQPSYKKITKDIRKVTKADLRGIDAIIHLAALSNDPMGALDDSLTEKINYEASVRLAKLAKSCGVKRFLFSSSCSIYGIAKKDTVDEKSPVNPLTAYAKSKIATEKALQKLADKNFAVGILRNSTVYGYSPIFRDDLVVNNFTACAFATKEIRVMSDGSPWRPLIDVRDLSIVFLAFLQADVKKFNGKIINIGFEKNNFQVKKVLSFVKSAVKGCKVIYTGEHGKDTRSYKVNFKKFKTLFPGVKQKWNLEKSIKDLVTHLRNGKFSKAESKNGAYTRLKQLKKLTEAEKITKSLYWSV